MRPTFSISQQFLICILTVLLLFFSLKLPVEFYTKECTSQFLYCSSCSILTGHVGEGSKISLFRRWSKYINRTCPSQSKKGCVSLEYVLN